MDCCTAGRIDAPLVMVTEHMRRIAAIAQCIVPTAHSPHPARSVDPEGLGVLRGQSMFSPPSHIIFHSKLCKFHIVKDERFVSTN